MVENDDGLFFPPELVPIAAHPEVARLGQAVVREVLIRRLYTYLQFTITLETECITPVSYNIARDQLGLNLPSEMMLDAYLIATDECYHAYFCSDLINQVEKLTGVSQGREVTPLFLRRLNEVKSGIAKQYHPAVDALFAVVSETLISSILSQIPRDPRVMSAVREAVRDHAKDESVHNVFFRQFFEYMWQRMSLPDRQVLGPVLPKFILAFLEPDYESVISGHMRDVIGEGGLQLILHDSCPPAALLRSAQKAAKGTLDLFWNAGVMREEETLDSFHRSGLLDGYPHYKSGVRLA